MTWSRQHFFDSNYRGDSLKIISLFSGAGGLDLGFEQQGFEPVIGYDSKLAAVKTYNHNRKKEIARVEDLSKKSGEQILQDLEGISPNLKPIGVVGGPPCQYFSNGNTTERDKNDPRRFLPIQYASILKTLNDQYDIDFFILENVDGLAQPAHKEDFKKICTLFSNSGFHISADILNAYDYGVPQIRNRLFIVGWNKKFYSQGSYKFPPSISDKLTLRDCISNLPEPVFYKKGLDSSQFPIHPNHWTMQPKSKKFKNLPPPEIKKKPRSFRRLYWDQPSDTVAYGHNEIHIHPNGDRRLSIYEAMLLQGFPSGRDGYQLLGTLSEQVSLVSDAVPPPLANILAHSIKEFMKEHKRL